MTEPVFQPWPKIARLNRGMVITEKIDGTNAAIGVMEDGTVYAQSRTRIITPESDNFGFARFVHDNALILAGNLGPGLHYGEWWGGSIQRGYGRRDKTFSLFNTSRWKEAFDNGVFDIELVGGSVSVVPVIYEGLFDQGAINEALDALRNGGSYAAPGFMDPEGIVIYMAASRTMYKVTLKNDEQPKGVADAVAA